jgi:hypothetical protein
LSEGISTPSPSPFTELSACSETWLSEVVRLSATPTTMALKAEEEEAALSLRLSFR